MLMTDGQTRFASLESTDNVEANDEIDGDVYANMLDDHSEAQPASPMLSVQRARKMEARSSELTEAPASPTLPMPRASPQSEERLSHTLFNLRTFFESAEHVGISLEE